MICKGTYYFSTQGCRRAFSSAFSEFFCFELPEAAAAAAAAALALLLKKFDAIYSVCNLQCFITELSLRFGMD